MKKIAELKAQVETLTKEKLNLDNKNQDLFNRLTECLTENSDLVEKIKRFEYMQSGKSQANLKSDAFILNNGINLDYLSIADNKNEEDQTNNTDLNKNNEGKYTINFKLNLKKNNYGLNRPITHGATEIGKKKDIMEISETMTQKPLSKV